MVVDLLGVRSPALLTRACAGERPDPGGRTDASEPVGRPWRRYRPPRRSAGRTPALSCLVRRGHAAPLVPGQRLLFAERGKVSDGIAADLGPAPGVISAATPNVRIDQAIAVADPCLTPGQELAGSEVLRTVHVSPAEDLGVDRTQRAWSPSQYSVIQ